MILNIKNYVNYNFKELFKKGHLAIGVLGAFGPALLVSYFILTANTPFNVKHVSNFYCMLGMLAAVLHPLYFVNRDYSSKTISLINNSKQNRKNYVLANVVIALLVSLLYVALGIGLLLVTQQLGVPGELKVSFLLGFFVNVFLLVLTYFLLGYILLLYGVRSGAVYGILTAMLLFFPNILANILESTHNKFLSGLIENFPGYFYPVMVGSNPLSLLQYFIGCFILIVLFVLVLKKSKKIEI
ncbi:ABC transporter permease [Bacillus atrophaeus]|uniref:ABC transporter permease n=1 Tax=Bacillus atrophaeus TaxID=1452 RepID=UPI00227EA532|nr:ABC transporter permease [Bacillus atrophaeus]MCY8463604.1 ABC transporter permease [Bacillus atrophaeus]MCY8477119.1 ABC transporter permease [Bacillus atrophaeus]MCY8913307.1 ABC transporter permease [Bacillus atrophaeus]MCY8915154.1 ABC transporter permease [Bacillus atrophaeus]MCY8924810.1 ABC transporter permease [Bacillus atrophaeus]